METSTERELLRLGVTLGRSQAFGYVAGGSLAMQAEHLRQIRDSGAYKQVGNWDTFCETEIGVSRQRVDAIIQAAEELGEAYTRLRQIVRISPDTFRQIQPHIQDQAIEIDGQLVPIAPENAPAIRDAVSRLRADLKAAQVATAKATARMKLYTSPDLTSLQTRLDALMTEFRRFRFEPRGPANLAFRGLIRYAIEQFQETENRLPFLVIPESEKEQL